jgi:hypothetical protein
LNKSIATLRQNVPGLVTELRLATKSIILSSPKWVLELLPNLAWATVSIFLGIIIGFSAVILPPTGAFGIPAVALLVLLWATRVLPAVPVRSLRKLFFIILVVDLCVPNYYAYQVPGLPWISVHRLFTFPVVMMLSIVIAGSPKARYQLAETLRAAKLISLGAIGFLVMIYASIFTSEGFGESLGQAVDAFLNWYVPLLSVALLIRTEADFSKLVRIIGWCALFIAMAGLFEIISSRNPFIEFMPGSLKTALMESNPAFAQVVMGKGGMGRGGLAARVTSLFTVPLSFGEFGAIVAPFGYAVIASSETLRVRILGFLIAFTGLASVFGSGARGGWISFLAASIAFAALWTLRQARFNKNSLVPAAAGAIFAAGFLMLGALIIVWPRLHAMVLGDASTAASDQARWTEWRLATPHILANPVTGHGFSMGGYVVGYYPCATCLPTVDSYIVSLLVETGVPGLVFFCLMLGAGIWFGAKACLTDRSRWGVLAGGLACALIAFTVNRLVLSARENHTLLFLFLGATIVLAKLRRDRDALGKDSGSQPGVAALGATQRGRA